MKKQTARLLGNLKNKKVGLFVDNANWFYPQRELNLRISFKKLKQFLGQHCDLVKLQVYAGTPFGQAAGQKFDLFTKALRETGFTVVTKPLKKIRTGPQSDQFHYKCNFDVEIVADICQHLDQLDYVILGSGDSDFVAVAQLALNKGKGFMSLSFERGIAWEMRQYHHAFMEDLAEHVAFD